MLRDLEALAPSLGRAIAIEFPILAVTIIAFLLALISVAVIWRRIAPLRERVRLANEANDRKQRKLAKQSPKDR